MPLNSNPLISVIMSVYNEQEYIKDAVCSILKQTEPDFEFIIIDDCSTDDTVNIIKDINDDRIILIKNETNMGLTKNLNKALAVARGRFIARMDGDDIAMPERFATQVRYLDEHPDIMLVSCNTSTFGEQRLVSDITGSPEELRCTMLLRPVLAHPGFMFRKELYDSYGFKYDEHFRSAQDYDFAARVTRKYKIGVTPEVLLMYRAHKGQVSQTPTLKQFGFADEVRMRLLEELEISPDEGEVQAYHKWVLESDASLEEFMACINVLKRICQGNAHIKIVENNAKTYDRVILKKTLWYQYFKWMLRTNGRKNLFSVCGGNPVRYFNVFATAIKMSLSKKKRDRSLTMLP